MNKLLDRLEEIIIAALMAVATVVIFVSVVHRYASGYEIPVVQDWLLDMNLGWAQEWDRARVRDLPDHMLQGVPRGTDLAPNTKLEE